MVKLAPRENSGAILPKLSRISVLARTVFGLTPVTPMGLIFLGIYSVICGGQNERMATADWSEHCHGGAASASIARWRK